MKGLLIRQMQDLLFFCNFRGMRKLFMTAIFAILLPLSLSAQQVFPLHEFRLGWGDMGFEKAAFHNSQEYGGYSYAGHFFAGYRYSFFNWFSAGLDVDFSNVGWEKLSDGSHHSFQNISFIPELRFSYFRKGIVTMYSGVGFGLNVNTGTEVDYLGRRTVCAPVFNPVLYAVSVDWRNWFGTFALAPLVSFNGKNEIFMLGSRMISFSIGYRL